jgi:hypothetical protein
MKKEIWRVIKQHPNYYISNLGNIRNKKGDLLSLSDNRSGYLKVCLGRGVQKYVHRLVCIEFINNGEPTKLHVNHKDGNRSNNNLSNLELVTRSENDIHKMRVLRYSHPVIDKEMGIFYSNSQELIEYCESLIPFSSKSAKEYLSGRRKNNRFQYA